MAHKLPGELWLYIFSVGELEDAWHRGGLQRYCGERAQFLSTCSLVCRDWRELAQPLLFRNPVLRDCQLERWLSVLPTCKAAQVQWTVSREFRFTFRHTTNVLPRELGRDALKGLPRPSGRKKRVFFACDAACGDACLLKIDRCFIKELVDWLGDVELLHIEGIWIDGNVTRGPLITEPVPVLELVHCVVDRFITIPFAETVRWIATVAEDSSAPVDVRRMRQGEVVEFAMRGRTPGVLAPFLQQLLTPTLKSLELNDVALCFSDVCDALVNGTFVDLRRFALTMSPYLARTVSVFVLERWRGLPPGDRLLSVVQALPALASIIVTRGNESTGLERECQRRAIALTVDDTLSDDHSVVANAPRTRYMRRHEIALP